MLENERVIARLTQGKLTAAEALEELHTRRATDGNGLAISMVIAVCDKEGHITEQTASGHRDWHSTSSASPDDTFRIYSATKTFTSEVIQQQCLEGKLNPLGSVQDILQKMAKDPFMQKQYGSENLARGFSALKLNEKATTLDLLMHTSGLASYSDGNTDAFKKAVYAAPDKHWSMPELLRFTPSDEHQHGTFRYSDSGYLLLTMIAEYVDQTPYREIFKKRCFQKYGLAHTCFAEDLAANAKVAEGYVVDETTAHNILKPVSHMHYHTSLGTGGLFSTAQDMLQWLPPYLEREMAFFNQLQKEHSLTTATVIRGAIPSHIDVAQYKLGSMQQTVPTGKDSKAAILEGVGGYARGGRTKLFRDKETGKSVVILETWENLTVNIARKLRSKPLLSSYSDVELIYTLRSAYTDSKTNTFDRNRMLSDYNSAEKGLDFIAKQCLTAQKQNCQQSR